MYTYIVLEPIDIVRERKCVCGTEDEAELVKEIEKKKFWQVDWHPIPHLRHFSPFSSQLIQHSFSFFLSPLKISLFFSTEQRILHMYVCTDFFSMGHFAFLPCFC